MRDFAEIEADLRFAADNGCDYTLLIEAAEALAKENELIQKLAGIVVRNAQIRITVDEVKEAADQIERGASEESGTTVYMRMQTWTSEKERRIMEDIMNRSSPDRIVMLPSHIEIMNPEELQTIKTKILGE